jgi:repressor LexA
MKQTEESRKIFAYNLKTNIEQRGLTVKEWAKRIGVAYTTAIDWVNAKTYPRIEKIDKIADYFGVDKSDLIEPKTNKPSNLIPIKKLEWHRIPVIGTIACGDPIDAEQNIVDYLELPGHLPDGAFALICEGDSMEPGLQDGDRVVIEPTPNVEDGEVAAVLVDGDTKATLKKVRHVGDTIWLMPTNPAYSPIVLDKDHPGRILGKKIQMIRYGSR